VVVAWWLGSVPVERCRAEARRYMNISLKRYLLSFRSLAILLALLGTALLVRAEDIKSIHPTGYVTDLAGVIAPDTKAQLEALCTEVEQKTGAQIAVVTVHSIGNQSIEDYAADLYKQLGVGDKQSSRGVLLLLAPDLRQYRIEVGYGLEPVITDGRAGNAGRAMVPLLRQGDYSGAISTATSQLANYIAADRGVTLAAARAPVPEEAPPTGGGWNFQSIWLILGILYILFVIIRRASYLGRSGRGYSGSSWWLVPLLFGGGGGRNSGWGGGGYSGGGFGGGGGGFGGFGGGMSGGGGASGSW
jgi:uncharacterized protein